MLVVGVESGDAASLSVSWSVPATNADGTTLTGISPAPHLSRAHLSGLSRDALPHGDVADDHAGVRTDGHHRDHGLDREHHVLRSYYGGRFCGERKHLLDRGERRRAG
jgi:hypothetical protein